MTADQCYKMNDALNAASNWVGLAGMIPSPWSIPLAGLGYYKIGKWNQELNYQYCGGPPPAWPF